MSNVIVYKNASGGVSVVYPTGELPLDDVIAKDVPAGAEFFVSSKQALPLDRDFRAAWRINGSELSVDTEAAKSLTKDRLRVERAPLLEALDVQYVRALEEGKDTSAIVAEKNRLRDITKAADDAQSLDDLRKLSASAGKG